MPNPNKASLSRGIAVGNRLEPVRVLVVHNAYQQRGGEDRVVEDEVELLRSRGHEVRLFSKDNREIAASRPLPLFFNTLWSRRCLGEFRNDIQSFRPDIIHIHNTFPLISPSIYWGAVASIPIIQTLHNFRLLCIQAMFLRDDRICEDCLGKSPWRGVVRQCYRDSVAQSATAAAMLGLHRVLGTFHNKVARYIALSAFARDKFIQSGEFDADRLVVKPNFVDVESNDLPEVRSGGLFVGRISREKGIRVLAEAFAKLPNCELDVIGTGPEQQALEGYEKLRLLGWREKAFVLEKMRSARYLLLPSICYENFPRTVVEAFACGLPVIASRSGSMPEIIEEGRNGLLFAPGSADDLASKIVWAEANPDAMAAMGRNARASYEENYTASKNYDQLIQIYADAMAWSNGTRLTTPAMQQA